MINDHYSVTYDQIRPTTESKWYQLNVTPKEYYTGKTGSSYSNN